MLDQTSISIVNISTQLNGPDQILSYRSDPQLMNQHSYLIWSWSSQLTINFFLVKRQLTINIKYIPGKVSFHNWFYYYIRFVCLYWESRGPNKPLSEPNHRRELKTERARDSCCYPFQGQFIRHFLRYYSFSFCLYI